MRDLGNDTVMAKCEYHCAHDTGWSSGVTSMKCCWCGETVMVPYTFELLPKPGHGTYSAEVTKVYDWPRGWGFRKVPKLVPGKGHV
jgi:hypothetical protein